MSISHQRKLMVFPWSLCDRRGFQISGTLLNILADLDNVLVWIISTRPSLPVPVPIIW